MAADWTWDVLTGNDRDTIVDTMVKNVEIQYWNLKILKRRLQVRPVSDTFSEDDRTKQLDRVNNQMAALTAEKAEIEAAKGGSSA